MEQLPHGELFDCPMSRFVREDIVELMTLFVQNCKTYEFVIGGYKLNNIEEIDDIPLKEVNVFKLQGYNPFIYVEAHAFQCRISLSNTVDVIQLGMKEQIKAIFNRNRSIFTFVRAITYNLVLMFFIGCAISIISLYFGIIGGIMLIFVLALTGITYYISMNKYVIVYLKRSRLDLSLWEKYGENAIVTFLITIVGGLIVAVLTKLI